ncbi:MAG TPA: response regulator [Ktedonobacterales bacterium]|nr:response regulator [Ktedonobacterales bacterium]
MPLQMAGELILIVEDNDLNLELVRDLLQVSGYRTLEAVNATDGVALAAAHHPDLILMDVQLPDSGGVAALHHLRAQPDLVFTTVVALTAFAMRDDRERLLAAGFDGYMSKPIEIRMFLEQVQQFCRQRK